MEEKRKTTRKRSGQISGVQVMFAAILSIGLILAINFSARIASSQPLLAAYSKVNTEIATLQADQAQLTVERDYVLSDAYVEAWARSDGKMVKPGETLVIPVPSAADVASTEEAPMSAEQPTGDTDQTQPWVIWWQIFFDGAPPNIQLPFSNGGQ